MIRAAIHRWLSLHLLILAVVSVGLFACQASTETKQGGLGEFCNNRDSDCRPGLVCDNSECTLANTAAIEGCEAVCNKLQSCALEDVSCISDCQDEIKDWSAGVIDLFAACVVEDLACEELGASADQAAQICYDRLPLDEERRERCRMLKREIDSCLPNPDSRRFYSDCIYFARTTNPRDWSKTDQCAESIEFGGPCSETMECINTVFGLEGDQRF